MDKKCNIYNGKVHSCGIETSNCPHFVRMEKQEEGAAKDCKKCKAIFECNVEKKGYNFCHECPKYPCGKFKKFAKTWAPYGIDLYDNQKIIKKSGESVLFKLPLQSKK